MNLNKSQIYGWNCPAPILSRIAQLLHVKANSSWTHFNYLGIPIVKKSFASSMWTPIIQKIKDKINSLGSKWLNLAGKTVLIRSILSSYPIYTSSMVLAPRNVMNSISKEIKKFLWQGGKTQTKKFHLINWDTVKKPKNQGGTGIRDPEHMGKAMGAKLVWRLISGRKEWWKEVIRKKYIKRPRSQMITNSWEGHGTNLWQLCKVSFNLVKEDLYWIPGNGRKINLWESKILGQPPRLTLQDQNLLAEWAYEQGISTLYDISVWDAKGIWAGWKELSPPVHLRGAADSLLSSLHGLSPSKATAKDRIGWGKTGKYNVKEGYRKIAKESTGTNKLWKKVWHPDCIPKVNSFIWLLLHNKILTAENLQKRGISGPSRCSLCNCDEETISHLFLQCNFSQLVWQSVLPPGMALNLPASISQLFVEWSKHLPGSMNKIPTLQRLWDSIPKNLCWQLWLARNKAIFKEQKAVSARVAAKTIGMIVEKFASNNISLPDNVTAHHPYFEWCKTFLKEKSPLQPKFSSPGTVPLRNSCAWEIRLSNKDFNNWLRDKNSYALFFDGASKGNPGVAGAGGILLDPGGQMVETFAWGLGVRTNNEAEWLALLQGLQILQ